jgi:hypothetical protein
MKNIKYALMLLLCVGVSEKTFSQQQDKSIFKTTLGQVSTIDANGKFGKFIKQPNTFGVIIILNYTDNSIKLYGDEIRTYNIYRKDTARISPTMMSFNTKCIDYKGDECEIRIVTSSLNPDGATVTFMYPLYMTMYFTDIMKK